MSIGKIILSMALLSICVFAPALVQAEEALPVVNGIRVFRSGDDIGVEISADKNFEHTSYKMRDLFRVVIDLPGTQPVKPEAVYRYKSIMISNIWLEKRTINGVPVSRISVNLTEDADYEVRTDPSDSRKLRLLLHKPAPVSSAASAAAVSGKDAKVAAASPGKPAVPVAAPAKDVSQPAASGTGQPVTVTRIDCGADSIQILSSAAIGGFKAFTLQKPERLVLDISGAQSTLRSVVLPANRFGASKARLASFEGKLRIVFDAQKEPFPAYEIVKTAAGLRIVGR